MTTSPQESTPPTPAESAPTPIATQRSPRLTVGIISAGAVGTALGEAFELAGHTVVAAVARSGGSQARLAARLPNAQAMSAREVARASELIIIAVPDPAIPEVVADIAPVVGPGRIVLHTAGSLGRAVLDPIALTGALTIAAHPAMTFAGLSDDAHRLNGCPWGVTVGDELSKTVAELLIGEIHGRVVVVPEKNRTLYHAAMAHGSNHLGAIVTDAVELLATALETGGAGDYTSDTHRQQAAALLETLLNASLQNTLRWGSRGLTGPVVRDDVGAVDKHLGVISAELPGAVAPYRTMARRIAELRGATEVLKRLSD